jgi:hypothetical protein
MSDIVVVEPATQTPVNPVANGTPCSITAEASATVQHTLLDLQPYTENPTWPHIDINNISSTGMDVDTSQLTVYSEANSESVPFYNGALTLTYDLIPIDEDQWFLLYGNKSTTPVSLSQVVISEALGSVTVRTRDIDVTVSGLSVVGKIYKLQYSYNPATGVTVSLLENGVEIISESSTESLSDIDDIFLKIATNGNPFGCDIRNFELIEDRTVSYSVTADDVEVSTTLPYNFTAGEIPPTGHPFGTEFDVLADDGSGAVSLGTVTLQEIGCSTWDFSKYIASIKYKCEYDIAMLPSYNNQGIVSWSDMYTQHDTFASSIDIEVDRTDALGFESCLKGIDVPNNVELINIDGFYPFTPFFDYSSGVTVAVDNLPKPKEVNLYGDAVQYDISIIPNYSNGIFAGMSAAPAIPQCGDVPQDWELNTGLWLPYPEGGFKSTLNQTNKATQTNGGANSTQSIYKPNGEVCKISVDVDEETARQLVEYFSVNRGGDMDSYFPDGLHPFAHLYDSNNYFTTRLYDNKISFRLVNHKSITVDFVIQLIEVVS